MLRNVLMLTAITSGVIIGLYALPVTPSSSWVDPPMAPNSVSSSDAEGPVLCHGSTPELEIEAFFTEKSNDSLTFEFRSHMTENSSLVYGVEMSDDRGLQVIKPMIAEPLSISRHSVLRKDISLPSTLKDGYYALRLTAAAADSTNETASTAAVFFQMDDGVLKRISDEQFYLQSEVNAAVTL